MGVLSVSVDDLLGYSKLQDTLLQIISRINEQDKSLEQLKSNNGGVEERFKALLQTSLGTQEGMIEKLRAENAAALARLQDSTTGRLAAAEKAMEAKLSELNMKSGSQEAVEALRRTLEPRLESLSQELGSLGVNLQVSSQHVQKMSAEMQDLHATCQSAEGRLAALEQSKVQVSKDLGTMSSAVSKAEALLETHSASIEEMGGSLRAVCDAAAGESMKRDAAEKELSEQIATLRSMTQELRKDLESNFSDMRRDTAERLAGVEQKLLDVSSFGSRLETAEMLEKNNRSEIERASRELSRLKALLDNLVDKGSSATTKCISCFNRRFQEENKFLTGSDGKIYQGEKEPSTKIRNPRPSSALKSFHGGRNPGAGIATSCSTSTRPSSAVHTSRRSPASHLSDSLPDLRLASTQGSMPELSHLRMSARNDLSPDLRIVTPPYEPLPDLQPSEQQMNAARGMYQYKGEPPDKSWHDLQGEQAQHLQTMESASPERTGQRPSYVDTPL